MEKNDTKKFKKKYSTVKNLKSEKQNFFFKSFAEIFLNFLKLVVLKMELQTSFTGLKLSFFRALIRHN